MSFKEWMDVEWIRVADEEKMGGGGGWWGKQNRILNRPKLGEFLD
jgi:hypothetical protein